MADLPIKETRKAKRLRQMLEFCGHIQGSATISDAARKTGISVRQSSRWLRSPEFKDAFVELHRPDLQSLGKLAASLSVPALARLGHIVADPESAPTAVVGAAKIIQDLNLALDERNELKRRIAELEARAAKAGR